MTKVTKTEKILRKATSKWENFLAEGAFNKQTNEGALYHGDDAKDDDGNPIDLVNAPPGVMWKGKPMQIDDNGQRYIVLDNGKRLWATITDDYYEEGKVNEGGTMGEYGAMDAEQGLPPTKIGRGNEEYMAAYNAVLQARGEEPLDIQKTDQAYLDALQRGNLEEQEEKSFQVGEFVYVIDGGLRGATGKIAEPTTLVTGEQGYVIHLYSDADKKVFGKRGDEVIAGASKLRSGGTFDGSELYDIDERSEDDERDLEEPVKFASGAKLEFDPKAERYYDRGRDMYIDDPEEEDNLTREDRTTMSSDPELDQIEDIARDMLEAGVQNSRIPVSLVSVASALKAQGFDANVSGDVLNIDGKYFMGKKENFDISPGEDVRQLMGYVLGFMG